MQDGIDSRYAWLRLSVTLALMTIGATGMFVISVALPAVQADFGIDRSSVSSAYTMLMIGFGLGGILMGRLADRFGVAVPVAIGAVGLGGGFIAAGLAPGIVSFGIVHGLLIGLLGTSATFSPLVADTSLWFERRRGLAVAICASGNYLGGAFWPPIVQHFIETVGWRQTYIGIGVMCLLTMLPLALLLRRRPPGVVDSAPAAQGNTAAAPAAAALPSQAAQVGQTGQLGQAGPLRPLGMSPAALQTLLCIAGVACCVAMAMPQVHIVAYCSDLGFGPARGAQMLALMLGFGVISRLASGWISDRIGGLRTLLLGSILQGLALLLFLPFDGLASLYVISALFGLFQGGIVPSYALIVRENFPASEAGGRVAVVISSTLLGMALGGWMSGAVFDYTGSYHAAFINGVAWNLLNLTIAVLLLRRAMRMPGRGLPPVAAMA
ncbi:MAG: MFS transporter [Burkholderiales bacterium]|jgi:MFS family permease|nr:MFS transporter [Burkholderiales bacterium]